MKVKEFFVNMAKGAAIGLAMIVPGVSGGTLAVLLKIYDKIIDSIGDLFKHFKESFLFLLPVFIGAAAAFAAAYFPLTLALKYAPFPTMLLFAGLMAGSLPKLFFTCKDNGFKPTDVICAFVPLAAVIGVCFIPGLTNANLTDMDFVGFLIVFLVGIAASCALVVPGISGSMLLIIFGYYQPLLELLKGIAATPGHSIAVLGCFVVGVIAGFFTIAKLMQLLLKKFPRGTYWAIFGFVVGSIPAVIITFFNKYGDSPETYLTALHIALGVILFIAGAVGTYLITYFADRIKKRDPLEEAQAGRNSADLTEGNAPAESPAEPTEEGE